MHGGLDLCNLNYMNQAFLMKISWGLKDNLDRLWCRLLEGKYGRGTFTMGNFQVKMSESISVGRIYTNMKLGRLVVVPM